MRVFRSIGYLWNVSTPIFYYHSNVFVQFGIGCIWSWSKYDHLLLRSKQFVAFFLLWKGRFWYLDVIFVHFGLLFERPHLHATNWSLVHTSFRFFVVPIFNVWIWSLIIPFAKDFNCRVQDEFKLPLVRQKFPERHKLLLEGRNCWWWMVYPFCWANKSRGE